MRYKDVYRLYIERNENDGERERSTERNRERERKTAYIFSVVPFGNFNAYG